MSVSVSRPFRGVGGTRFHRVDIGDESIKLVSVEGVWMAETWDRNERVHRPRAARPAVWSSRSGALYGAVEHVYEWTRCPETRRVAARWLLDHHTARG